MRVRKRPIAATSISIPNARSNPASRRALHVCQSAKDEDGRIRAGILGALRYEEKRQGWAYPGADDDYVAATAIIDNLVAQAEHMALQDADLQIRTLAQGLLIQARIAGLSPPLRAGNIHATLSGLFEPLPARSEQGFDPNWENLRAAAWSQLGGRPVREVLQLELQGLMATFQGTSGGTPYGLDSVRLLDSLVSVDEADSNAENISGEMLIYLRQFADSRVWGQLQPLIGKLRDFRSDMSAFVDEGFEKAAFIKNLEDVVGLLVGTAT